MFGRAAHIAPAITSAGIRARSMIMRPMGARFMHAHDAQASTSEADYTQVDGSELFAVERSSPIVHTRLSYLSPETRPKGKKALSYVPMSAHVFNAAPHQHAMHMAVVYYLDALRSGTASTKTRSEVSRSGRKLRPQKGSGKARLSDAGSPMLRGGGVAHGPKPRDFKTELPRKVRELALRSALSARLQEGSLHVVPSLHWYAPPMSTNKLARLLSAKQWTDALLLTAPRQPVLPMTSERGAMRPSSVDLLYTDDQIMRHAKYIRNFDLASRNLPDVQLMRLHELPPHPRPRLEHEKQPGELHAYQVLQYKRVIMDLGALEWLEAKLGGSLVHQVYAEEMLHWNEQQPPFDTSETHEAPPAATTDPLDTAVPSAA